MGARFPSFSIPPHILYHKGKRLVHGDRLRASCSIILSRRHSKRANIAPMGYVTLGQKEPLQVAAIFVPRNRKEGPATGDLAYSTITRPLPISFFFKANDSANMIPAPIARIMYVST
jgi:hypothetical protein